MLDGLVQHDHPLTVNGILERMRTVNGQSTVVTLRAPGHKTEATYAEVAARADRLAAALTEELGMLPGDRVGTFMWNSQEHLELYLAVPSSGAVLHTLNLRLFPEQLTYIVNHAKDRVIFIDDSVVPLIEGLTSTFETVEHFVLVGDGDAGSLPNVIRYEELLARHADGFTYPEIDDRAAAGLCYTSGTTGDPKGVLYSHRSTVMHAMAECMADALGVSSRDRVLPVVPMFHANAWGLPYACALVGADLVMPSRFLQAEPLVRLVEEERCTIAGAVPTIWMDVLRYADEHKPDLSSLRCVPCGGAAVPRSLMQGFQERHGVPIVQAWGMTETSPLGAVAHAPRGVTGEDAWSYRTLAGRILPLVEARIVADDGSLAPWDGVSTGELQVRGPWIASGYYLADDDGKFDDGWLRTGDVAAIDALGYIRITDRSKDVIKSGGEWISSVDLENELMGHPAIREAAVIAKPDERWSERPLACVVLDEGQTVEVQELIEFLTARVAKFWVPDEFAFIGEVPKTSVGKFDKKVLRGQLDRDELPGRVLAGEVRGVSLR
jgi:fatty-acyl-CoA synthase